MALPTSTLSSRPEVGLIYSVPISIVYLFHVTENYWLIPIGFGSLVYSVSQHVLFKKVYGTDLSDMGKIGQKKYFARVLSAVFGKQPPKSYQDKSTLNVISQTSHISKWNIGLVLFQLFYLVIFGIAILTSIILFISNFEGLNFIGLALFTVIISLLLMSAFHQVWGDARYIENKFKQEASKDEILEENLTQVEDIISRDRNISELKINYSIPEGGLLELDYNTNRELSEIDGELITAISAYGAFCDRSSYPQRLLRADIQTGDSSQVQFTVDRETADEFRREGIKQDGYLTKLQEYSGCSYTVLEKSK